LAGYRFATYPEFSYSLGACVLTLLTVEGCGTQRTSA
jgi:hypothetical protein